MNKKNNPFVITFGKEPTSFIPRSSETQEIINSFTSKNPDNQAYILTGLRGSGKTVCLTKISNYFKNKKDWIVIEINPELEILEQLASKLYDEGKLKKLFFKTEFNFSFKGLFGFSISGENPITNVSSLLKAELIYLKKKNINVLITIDEVSSNQHLKIFVHEFQIFMRNNYNVFLLMTGLYKNIYSLQNEKTLTFLNRAPRIALLNLNLKSIANSYKEIFELSDEKSAKLAKLTNGYPFAYQLLGDILYNEKQTSINQNILNKYDEALQERAYSLIYKELTDIEQSIVKSISKFESNAAVLKDTKLSKSMLSNYKKTLINKGVLEDNRTKLIFKLPRFKEYIEFISSIE